jgi:hypothetical protein
MWADEPAINMRFNICDRDTKFSEAFDEAFNCEKAAVVKTP